MKTAFDFFNHTSAVFQFPLCFGFNWNAFNDCMQDLEWLGKQHYIIFFTETKSILSCEKDDNDLKIFYKSIQALCASKKQCEALGLKNKKFRFIFCQDKNSPLTQQSSDFFQIKIDELPTARQNQSFDFLQRAEIILNIDDE